MKEDQRPLVERPLPGNKLSEAERSHLLAVCNQPEYASVPPGQIVPRLADKGQYLASESTFYRILGEAGQQNHRGRSADAWLPRLRIQPLEHAARQSLADPGHLAVLNS